MLPILETLLAGLAVGFLLDKLRMPGGMMIGAVIGSCAFGVITGSAEMPKAAKITAQIVAGAFIGSGVSRQELREMKSIAKPAAILLPGLLLINVACGFLIHWTSPADLITSFMCSTPGGVSDIPMIATDLGADTSKVVLMQFVRFMMGIALFPALIRAFSPKGEKGKESAIKLAKEKPNALAVILTLAAATAFGLLGMISPVPSGTMAFAVLGSMGFKLVYPKAQTPRLVRKIAQCLAGAFVGAGIGVEQLKGLPSLFAPILLMIACYLLGAFVISAIFRRTGCFGFTESMLATTPAGASDMALISADMGIRNIKLVLLQVLRLIVVISVFPTLLSLIASACT